MLKLAWKYMRYYKSQTLAIFASIILTAALLSGISSLMYSSQKSDLANSKTIYGDWQYCVETDWNTFQSVQSGEQGEGYSLDRCGKQEIRDAMADPFVIYFVYADDMYRRMAHREIIEGTYPAKENEIAADWYVLSNLGFSGNPGDQLRINKREYTVTGILESEWDAGSSEMKIFVSDSFEGSGSQTFLYLSFDEDEKLYKQLDAFQRQHHILSDSIEENDEVIQYLGGEKPEPVWDIVKFGLTDEDGNVTYIILKLQSDYNLAYNGMIVLLCLFSIFVVYSVFNISVAKRRSEYGILQTLGISESRIGGTLVLELWILFLVGYPLGCLLGNGILSLLYERVSSVFGENAEALPETGLTALDQTLARGSEASGFYISWGAMMAGFLFLLAALAVVGFLVVRSLRKQSLREVMNGDASYTKRRKIYAAHPVNMAGIVVRKFMFSNKKKVIGILLSLSIGGCIFLCTTYMVENLKVHAELSMKSDDGLGSEYRISLKSTSLTDTIPKTVAEQIKTMPETANVYATRYTLGELQLTEDEFLSDENWDEYFAYQNREPGFVQRYGGICLQDGDGTYRIKYDVYGYEEELVAQLEDFVLEGEINPSEIASGNQVIAVANMDGQGNYYFYGKRPGDTITLRVPKRENYTDELLKFQSGQENYIEKEFEIAAIVSRPLAQEEGFLNVEPFTNAQSIIMTNAQMEENFGLTDYSFIHASPASEADREEASAQILQIIRDVPKAVLQDYTAAIETQKSYLSQQQIFFTGIAVILLIISLFHIMNSMNYTILARKKEYGIMRAMGITDSGFYRMILQTGVTYGLLADVVIFFLYHLLLRRWMDYYMAHVIQFLHIQEGVPALEFAGLMVLNILISIVAVLLPARKLLRESMISELRA